MGASLENASNKSYIIYILIVYILHREEMNNVLI